MKFPVSWLKDHLETEADAAALADKLTNIGLEVESVENPAEKLDGFIVAEIVTADKHPNADRLHLCQVNTGKEKIQVVCGAPNARAGIKVVLARPGVTVPATGEILKVGTIRGVESRGMMCSERELGISDEHDGIVELAADATVGEPAAKALGLSDAIIDISITPNRGDCTSVWGVARDLAAAGMGTLKTPRVKKILGAFPSPKHVHIDFPEDKVACPIFAGRYIRNVKNGPSPKWVQERLKAIGLRPISALVDVSNLISHDRGRPLHVFDADKLKGDLTARLAKEGETLLALDGKTYALDPEMCVIADAETAQSISGIMGGAWMSGRLAGRIPPKHQIRHGFVIMLAMGLLNLGANLLFPAHVGWALWPIGIFSFGWALMVPVVTLLVLDLFPARRGMASSLQAFVGSTANGLVAGVVAPLVMHSTVLLATASLLMMCVGLVSWIYLHHRWPEIGRTATHS